MVGARRWVAPPRRAGAPEQVVQVNAVRVRQSEHEARRVQRQAARGLLQPRAQQPRACGKVHDAARARAPLTRARGAAAALCARRGAAARRGELVQPRLVPVMCAGSACSAGR